MRRVLAVSRRLAGRIRFAPRGTITSSRISGYARPLLLALLLGLPLLTQASGGSWSRDSGGGVISVGNQIMTGPMLSPSGPVPLTASVSRISWRIRLLNPPPPGLEIKLCTQAQCVKLDALAGHRNLPESMRPGDSFQFMYSVNARGPLRPAVNVVSQHLTVNYR
ncbi:flagellar protein FlhE [Enterobacteriaceae bacterium 4M9]|nr:flagellar protein FlhE [Enterobacteriaceae bacterium 4M9]